MKCNKCGAEFAFKKKKLSKILIASFVISLLCMFDCFFIVNVLAGIIALIQAGLYATSWLMGMGYVKEKFPRMHILLAVVGFAMIMVYWPAALKRGLIIP